MHWIDTVDCDLGYKCCPTIKPCTLSILKSFYLLATKCTKVFCFVWKDNMAVILSNSDTGITQEDIVQLVWKPTLNYCVKLISRLTNGSIALNEVERVFDDDEEICDIKLSCVNLVKSLVSCSLPEHSNVRFCTCECCTAPKIRQLVIHHTVKVSADLNWIETFCKQIKHYRLAKKCIECAKAIIALCDEDHLNLKTAGDFSSVFLLGEKVRSYSVINQ